MTQIPKFAEQVMRIMAQTAEEIPMLVFRDGNKEIAYRKKSDGSDVTNADPHTEAVLIERLQKLLPDSDVLAEETAGAGDAWKQSPLLKSPGNLWIIDPIDGTIDYRAKKPFGMLVGLRHHGAMHMAVAYYPVEQEFIWASQEIDGAFHCAIENIATGRISMPRALAMPKPEMKDTEIGYYIGHNDNRSLTDIMDPATVAQFAGTHVSVCVATAMRRMLLQGNYACLYNNYKPWDFEITSYITRVAGGVSVRFDGTPSRTASDAHNVILAPTRDIAEVLSSNIRQLWMVVREDFNENEYFVASNYASADAAQEKIDSIKSGWSTPHKQTFSIHDYAPTKLMQRLEELKIRY